MAAKVFRVSPDGINWAVMPGNSASFESQGEQLDTTIFGSDFNSSITGIISHSFSGNAMLRENAGYVARIRSTGTPTSFTNEATAPVNGRYQIVDRTKSIWDYEEAVVVSDESGVIDAADIAEIDYLQGRVTFVGGFSPDGAVTVSGDFLPTSTLGCFRSFDLTQSSDVIETGCFDSIGGNGGYELYQPTLRQVSLTAEGFYQTNSDFIEQLQARERYLIELDFEGNGETVVRGYFSIVSDSLDGSSGGDESESVNFNLFVPEGVKPFSWYFGANTKAPQGLIWTIEAWENKTNLYYGYYPNGLQGRGIEAQSVITDCSISTSVDGLAEASISGQGTGGLTLVNFS